MCACDLQNEDDPGEGCSRPSEQQTDRRIERSIEESRKLILQWASELQSVDKVKLTGKNRHDRLNHTVLEYTGDTDQLQFNHIWWLAQTKLSVCLCDPQLSKKHSWLKERIDQEEEDNTKQDKDQHEVVQKRITEWAKEIQSVSEVGQQKYLYYLGRWCLICCY